jgi:hypothetical protein
VLEYAIELPIKILSNVLEYQRVVIALQRGERRRGRGGADISSSAALRAEELKLAAGELATLMRRMALVGRSPKVASWGDWQPSTRAEGMLGDRLSLVPAASALMTQPSAKLEDRLRTLRLVLAANAKALQRGFGEQGRDLLLGHRVESSRGVLRALHPRMGRKALDSLVARNLDMANESVLRNRDKRVKARRY